ncbi:hypothetical protein PF005_g33448 [Phytophthora fragariae]|uniref:Secreted protein n=1 Tax=Phytophthora fragariae TaxID=53985 RepID=A0A6A3D619_9STRA|nr:hypothetical protein PF009_g33232 [Phytophthora fragariae]KAE8951789.1 hypothetical protein PF011_g32875 [Phytophthora fragariae]KAE9053147.1 hypothetical protein PF006_g33647 [Phytophthora fragariae]KAE9152819.1 hypothetical protein PF005_g33448 [Phytophthora fragariae]KAE9156665.1 hypothetical protein PF002_g33556 [Phytophthora fragariae]
MFLWSFVLLNAKAIVCIGKLPLLQLLLGRCPCDRWHGDPYQWAPCARCETTVCSSLKLLCCAPHCPPRLDHTPMLS